jgi:hypothetical protein
MVEGGEWWKGGKKKRKENMYPAITSHLMD